VSEELTVPGRWYCTSCQFQLFQRVLSAVDGSVGTRDDPNDAECPNCFVPLHRVTLAMAEEERRAFTCN
jgi:hypothetical protein